MRWLTRLSFLAAALYLAAASFMFLYQRDFLYKPAPDWLDPATHGPPRTQARDVKTPDGITLRGWWIAPQSDTAPVYLYFHGNARGLDRRTGRFQLMTQDGSGLLAMSYRGYGGSGGVPNERSLHMDARQLYEELRTIFPARRIVLFGESLGSGIALHLAKDVESKAVILDSPYLSVLTRGQDNYPWLPVSWLLKDTFRSDLWIALSKAPIFILHGRHDRLVPESESAALAKMAAPKRVERKLYETEHVVPYDRGPHIDVPAFLAGLEP